MIRSHWFKLLFNTIGFQAVWFTCAFTVNLTPPFNVIWIALVTFGFMAQHICLSHEWRVESDLIFKVSLIGFIFDTLLIQNHFIYFEGSYPGYLSGVQPFWMTCLWLSLGACLNHSLGWLKSLIKWSSLIGAVMGTFSYLAGAKLGVLSFGSSQAVMATALGWALTLPILTLLSRNPPPKTEIQQ